MGSGLMKVARICGGITVTSTRERKETRNGVDVVRVIKESVRYDAKGNKIRRAAGKGGAR